MTLADEIRATTRKIIQRHYGHLPDAIAAIRVSDVQKIDAFVEQAQDRLSRCTCQEPGFEIIERDDGKFAARMFGVYAKAEADFQSAKLRRPLEDRS